jgi:hypothetical protein
MLAAAALIPLLLHLRRGKVTRVVEFPGARYLARATQEHQRALRVRSSFLLLIQLAIVARRFVSSSKRLTTRRSVRAAAFQSTYRGSSPA